MLLLIAMTAIYDNICATAYTAKDQVARALESLKSQEKITSPDLTATQSDLRCGNLTGLIFDHLLTRDGASQVAKKLALALNRKQKQSPISEIPDTAVTAPTQLNDNNALEILAPLLTTFDRLFALRVELTKQFPNKHGNTFSPGPNSINKLIGLNLESVRDCVRVMLEPCTKVTRAYLLDSIAKKYEYGLSMARELTHFLNNPD